MTDPALLPGLEASGLERLLELLLQVPDICSLAEMTVDRWDTTDDDDQEDDANSRAARAKIRRVRFMVLMLLPITVRALNKVTDR